MLVDELMNPYDVLGVKETDTDQEINKAYRALAKKYHPDINPSEEASKKMVEINCAYDEIKKMREAGMTYSQYQQSTNSFQGDNYYQDAYNSDAYQNKLFSQVEAAIRMGNYFEAFILLQSNPVHNDLWFYYSAVIYAQTGNVNQAYQFVLEAIRLNPNRNEYKVLKEKLESIKFSSNYTYRRKPSLLGMLLRFIMIIIFLNILIGCVLMYI